MAVQTTERKELYVGFAFKPENLDVGQILSCLPGWQFNEPVIPALRGRQWHFFGPEALRGVTITRGEKRNTAEVLRLKLLGTHTDRVVVRNLHLVVAIMEPLFFGLSLYGSDGSCYITGKTIGSRPVEYVVSTYLGLDPKGIPVLPPRFDPRLFHYFESLV